MKKKFFAFAIFLLIFIGRTSMAQPVTTDALIFSQTNEGFATARATAMGGAIASLGGDISSLSYNPAGLAMYRNSEFVFVPQILSIRTNATYEGAKNTNGALAKFNASIGGVAYFGNDFSKHKFSLGFAYNRLKDFKGEYGIKGNPSRSIATLYTDQLNASGISGRELLVQGWAPFNTYPDLANAILALQSGMVDTLATNPNQYFSAVNTLAKNGATMSTSGYIDEYDFSVGYSHNDKLFLGLTIGLQNLYYYQSLDYVEQDISNNLAGQINELSASGFGVNFKLGGAYKITDALRLGVAIHTPTLYSIRQRYLVTTDYNDGNAQFPSPLLWEFSFNTPWKFIGGISYNILKRLTISADYQATLYNSARFRNYTNSNILNTGSTGITKSFTNVNNVRVGLEWNALQWKGEQHTHFLFVRGGYNYVSSPFTKATGLQNVEQYHLFTGGLGYKYGMFFADFGFSYADTKKLPWNIPNDYDINGSSLIGTDINPKTRTMNFILTIGFRF